jgi:hypothetical protein
VKDYAAWARRERTRGQRDLRVQAIRCLNCHRLRAYPTNRVPFCACGGAEFVKTFPHPDEEQIALRLYSRQLEENNAYGRIAQELIEDWERSP